MPQEGRAELGQEARTGQGPESGEVHMERARPMPRIQKKREVPASLRWGQARLPAVVQGADEGRQPEPRASVSIHSFPLLQDSSQQLEV